MFVMQIKLIFGGEKTTVQKQTATARSRKG
jgi:hypothetical protein